MGLLRKITSVSTVGLVDFRSDKERIARNTKATAKAVRQQTKALTRPPRTPAPPVAAPSWLPDPTGRHELRWWDGSVWTSNVADNGVGSHDPLPVAC